MFTDKIQWKTQNLNGMYENMAGTFWATTKSLIQGIPIGVLVVIGLIFVGMFIWQFLKDLKVV